MAKDDYAATVAAKLIEQLEQGTAPWQKPWRPGERQEPMNPTTGKSYRGMNSLWLEAQGRGDPRWMTYKQAAAIGAQVRKGEKGTLVEYWKFRDQIPMTDDQGRPVLDDEGRQRTVTVELQRPKVFRAVVFNAEQIDGLPPRELPTLAPEPERHARAEAILAASGANIRHVAGDSAYYLHSTDQITLPERNQFDEMSGYYAVAMHELGHWTGHESRLNRSIDHPFGSEGYAKEELRAEIASLMVGDKLGLGHDPGKHAAYVGSWIKALQKDPREVFRAAADAEKIAGYIFALERERENEQEQGVELSPAEREAGWRTPAEIDASREAQAARIRAPVLMEQPEAAVAERTYLAVPYSEKDAAKSLGAKWDKDAKAWYAPPGVDLAAGLNQWLPNGGNVIATQPAPDPRAEFAAALRDAGLILDGPPVMDGKYHRVPVAGDARGEKSGAYRGYLDGHPAGYYKNHKTGEETNWKSSAKVDSVSAEQRAQLAAEAASRQQQRQKEREAQQERAAATAASLFAIAPLATADNAYLQRKGIEQAPGLRTVPEPGPDLPPGVQIARTFREAKEMREAIKTAGTDDKVFVTGDLLVPAYDMDGKLWSLQSVNPGFKSFMTDGRKAGLHAIAGAEGPASTALNPNSVLPIVICEGYATGDSLAQAFGRPVVVAFDAGNLLAVAEGFRQAYPDRDILIAGDNDHAKEGTRDERGRLIGNVGVEKAREAAAKVGGAVLLPTFEPGAKGSDWNDVHQAKGLDDMRAELVEALAVAEVALSVARTARERGESRDDAREAQADADRTEQPKAPRNRRAKDAEATAKPKPEQEQAKPKKRRSREAEAER